MTLRLKIKKGDSFGRCSCSHFPNKKPQQLNSVEDSCWFCHLGGKCVLCIAACAVRIIVGVTPHWPSRSLQKCRRGTSLGLLIYHLVDSMIKTNSVHEGSEDEHRKALQAAGRKVARCRLITKRVSCTEISQASERFKLCDVMWNVFSEMDKVLPLSCIMWIMVFGHKVQAFQGLAWNEMKGEKKEVLKAKLKKWKKNQRTWKMWLWGLLLITVVRKNVVQSKAKNTFKIYLKSLTVWWSLWKLSSCADSFSPSWNRACRYLNLHNLANKWRLIDVTWPFKVPIICDNCNILNDAGSTNCLGAALARFENRLLLTTDLNRQLLCGEIWQGGQLCSFI